MAFDTVEVTNGHIKRGFSEGAEKQHPIGLMRGVRVRKGFFFQVVCH
jgi:hypothetical protein